ncbi:hypothetical protein GC169_12090 [bacterium]|nr:hypothetical protein [bacterium]
MKTCFVYTCNKGYLVPALVSAAGARANCDVADADVLILDISPPSPEGAAAERAAQGLGVRYIRKDPSVLEGLSIAYARLMLDRMLPKEYSSFIYVDSDTQVWGSVGELARVEVPKGRMLASRDPMTVMMKTGGKLGQTARQRLEGIGLRGKAVDNYINSGMFKVRREDWAVIARQCIEHIRAGGDQYRYADQDVINLVAHDRIDIISFKWNFPGFLLGSNVMPSVEPRIVHFMSNPRPWHGPFHPWGERGVQPYFDIVKAYPELEPNWPHLPLMKRVKYLALEQVLKVSENRYYAGARFRESFRLEETSALL